MNAGQVDLLVILGGNPVYTAPADLEFADGAGQGAAARPPQPATTTRRRSCATGTFPRRTSSRLERRARPSTARSSIVQPLIAPLYGGRSAHEVLAALERPAGASGVRHRPRALDKARPARRRDADFERDVAALAARRRRCPTRRSPRKTGARVAAAQSAAAAPQPRRRRRGLEIAFRHDPYGPRRPVRQQRLAAGAAEADHQAHLGQRRAWSARRPPRSSGHRDRAVDRRRRARPDRQRRRRAAVPAAARFAAPLFPVAGHPDDCVTVHLGYGRTRGGHVGTGAGFNANAHAHRRRAVVRRAASRSSQTGERISLACTQYHHLMEGRGMVRAVTRDEFVRDPKSVHEGFEAPPRTLTLYPELQVRGLQVGHGDRPERLHRLQRLRRRLPGGEQHPGGRQGAGAARPRDALAARRHATTAARPRTRRPTSSRCRACTARTRRARWSARSARRCTATKG